MKAIAETGNQLVAALDPNDCVGIIDSYFPDADFFTEFERFDRHVDKLRRKGEQVDYVSICSPNYLHDAHIRFALRTGRTPSARSRWCSTRGTSTRSRRSSRRPAAASSRSSSCGCTRRLQRACARRVAAAGGARCTTSTSPTSPSRGRWYHSSWKGDVAKSGGIATNIGVHFFDMLLWIFGPIRQSVVHLSSSRLRGRRARCSSAPRCAGSCRSTPRTCRTPRVRVG